MPTISWSGSTSSPRLAAKLVAGRDGVRQRYERDSHGADEQGADIGQFGPRQRWDGNAPRERADGLHAMGGQVEHGGDHRHADDSHQNGRHPTGDPGKDEENGQDTEAGHERRSIGLIEPVEEGAHLVDEIVGTGGEPEELGQLPDDDGDGEAIEVANADLTGEEIGDESESRHSQPDLDEPNQDRQHPGECDCRGGVASDHEGCDRGQDQRRN